MTRPADRCSSSTLRSRRPAAQSVVSTGGVGAMMIRAGEAGGMFTTTASQRSRRRITHRQRLGIVGSAAPGARLDGHGEVGSIERVCEELSFHDGTGRIE
eukprot:scaffold142027_cov157-Phaeocystis_antarctica.AAC.1